MYWKKILGLGDDRQLEHNPMSILSFIPSCLKKEQQRTQQLPKESVDPENYSDVLNSVIGSLGCL